MVKPWGDLTKMQPDSLKEAKVFLFIMNSVAEYALL